MPWVKVDIPGVVDGELIDIEAYLTQEEADNGYLLEFAPDGMGYSPVALYKWLEGHVPRSPGYPQLLLQATPQHPAFGHRPEAEVHQLTGSVREPIDLQRLREQSVE